MSINLPKIIGHRGVKDLAPENTIFAINEAIKHKLEWIEIDVKISKDNIPFLLHDDLLNRTTSGTGYPYQYNYEVIKNLDAGTWFDPKFNYLYPPTLKEVLDICSNKKIGVNIELKPNKKKEKDNAEAISHLFKKNNFHCQYFFSSFDLFSIKLIRNLMPNVFLGYLIDNYKDTKNFLQILENCLKLKCFCMGFNIKLINQEIVKICKDNKLKVTVYANKKIRLIEAQELWSLGVDSIFIDDPNSFV